MSRRRDRSFAAELRRREEAKRAILERISLAKGGVLSRRQYQQAVAQADPVFAAIYARKSTDQNIADEEKSVTRQIERARAHAVELSGQRHGSLGVRCKAIEAGLRRVERELGRFVEALAGGDSLPSVVEAMRTREQRRAGLKAQLEHLDGLERAGRPMVTGELRGRLRARLESWGALLGRTRLRPGRSCACSSPTGWCSRRGSCPKVASTSSRPQRPTGPCSPAW